MADFSCFDSPDALALNKARQDHFDSLGIDLSGKSVLEVGCGVGHFTRWLEVKKPQTLTAIDARPDNVTEAHKRCPRLFFICMDIEKRSVPTGVTWPVPVFDAVLCYGLLYHLQNPLLALRNMASYSRDLLVIESIICDSHLPICRLELENPQGQNQGVSTLAMIPSIRFVERALKALDFQVYRPLSSPYHPDFRWFSVGDDAINRNGANLRAVVIGSRVELKNERLYRV